MVAATSTRPAMRGMATGGTGDVLTGMLAGLTAEFGTKDWDRVLGLGVYLHGLAGDVAAERRRPGSVSGLRSYRSAAGGVCAAFGAMARCRPLSWFPLPQRRPWRWAANWPIALARRFWCFCRATWAAARPRLPRASSSGLGVARGRRGHQPDFYSRARVSCNHVRVSATWTFIACRGILHDLESLALEDAFAELRPWS